MVDTNDRTTQDRGTDEDLSRRDLGQQDLGRRALGQQDLGRQDPGRRDRGWRDPGRPDRSRQDPGWQELGAGHGLGSRQQRSTRATRVVLVVEDVRVRRGLSDLLSASDDLAVVGSARSTREALPLVTGSTPDLVLLDAQPGGAVITACRELRAARPSLRCVLLTSFDDDEALLTTALAGAAGYLVREIGGTTIVDGLRRVALQQSGVDPAAQAALLQRRRPDGTARVRLPVLSEVERTVLELVSAGRTDGQVAAQLGIADSAVRSHVLALLGKLSRRRRP